MEAENGQNIKFEDGGEFINFKPKTVMTLLAELMADQEGRKAVDIRIMKKEERTA